MQCWLGFDVCRVVSQEVGCCALCGLVLPALHCRAQLVVQEGAAVVELAAVSLQGPVKLVCFDLETTCCELVCVFISASSIVLFAQREMVGHAVLAGVGICFAVSPEVVCCVACGAL
jgi:hypothetical protein